MSFISERAPPFMERVVSADRSIDGHVLPNVLEFWGLKFCSCSLVFSCKTDTAVSGGCLH